MFSQYFKEPEADADGLHNGCLHSPVQSRLIQSMSWWAVGTALQGIIQGKPVLGTGVLIGSVIAYSYWARPCFGWRRTLDMIWIQVLLWPHLYYGWYSPVRTLYYSISAFGAVSYGLSWWCFLKRRSSWASTIAHMMLTACANLSLTVLYAYPLA